MTDTIVDGALAEDGASAEASDAELLTALRAGDEHALAVLWQRHVPAARRLAAQVAPPSEVDDLVSESFTRVWRAVQGGGGPDAAFRPYLLSTVRRTSIDVGRTYRSRVVLTDDERALDTAALDTPAQLVDDLEEHRTAWAAWKSLPEESQVLLWHLLVEEETPATLAPILGVSANGVSSRAKRAKERLRQAFLSQNVADAPNEECRRVRLMFGAYVREALSTREREVVDGHLEDCDRCRAALLMVAETNQSMRVLIVPLILGAVAAKGYLTAASAAAAELAGSGAAATAGSGAAAAGSGAAATAGSGAAATGGSGAAATGGSGSGSGSNGSGTASGSSTAGGAGASGAATGLAAVAGAAAVVGAATAAGMAADSASLAAGSAGSGGAASGAAGAAGSAGAGAGAAGGGVAAGGSGAAGAAASAATAAAAAGTAARAFIVQPGVAAAAAGAVVAVGAAVIFAVVQSQSAGDNPADQVVSSGPAASGGSGATAGGPAGGSAAAGSAASPVAGSGAAGGAGSGAAPTDLPGSVGGAGGGEPGAGGGVGPGSGGSGAVPPGGGGAVPPGGNGGVLPPGGGVVVPPGDGGGTGSPPTSAPTASATTTEPTPTDTGTNPPTSSTSPGPTGTSTSTTTEPPTTEPPVTTTEPPVTTTEPPVTTTEPPVTTTEPPATTTEPPVTTTEPPVTTTEPPVTTTTSQPTTSETTTTAPAPARHTFTLEGRTGTYSTTLGILGSWRIVSVVTAGGTELVPQPLIVFSESIQGGGPITVIVEAQPGAQVGAMAASLIAPNGSVLPGSGLYLLQP